MFLFLEEKKRFSFSFYIIVIYLWLGVRDILYLLYLSSKKRGTLRFHHETGVDFDKICMFCDICCVCIDKYMFIVVKIKYVNFSRISDIYDKVNFTTNYTHFTTLNKYIC